MSIAAKFLLSLWGLLCSINGNLSKFSLFYATPEEFSIAIASGLLPLVLVGSFGNFWNLLIGFFLLQNAGNAAQVVRVQEQLTGLTAGDIAWAVILVMR
ncbi:hypothetical protein IJ00_08625 [Calothrix sp. 336/3]|nr:hypothetical protein IJ00_08625 [Calothrix sp. 336/3]